LGFDKTGAISTLISDQCNIVWAAPGQGGSLASLVYTTWDESGYNTSTGCEAVLGGKPGSDEANPMNANWTPMMQSLWYQLAADNSSCQFYVSTSMPSETIQLYGGFELAWMLFNVTKGATSSTIDINYQIFNKTSTRLAESYMLYFTPVQFPNLLSWTMNKLNSQVSPTDVINGGSQFQHSVWDGVTYSNPNEESPYLSVRSPDVPLVSPVTTLSPATPLTQNLTSLPGDMLGFAFNIYNNVWDTNYILWYPYLKGDENLRTRYQVAVSCSL